MTTLAYLADPAITKAAFLDVLRGHQEADRIVQGAYWENGKGCAVGCGIHSVMALTGRDIVHDDHAALAAALGANETLLRLQDCIFEGLPPDEARLWPVRFAQAIPAGANLDGVWTAFAQLMQRRMLARDIAHELRRAGWSADRSAVESAAWSAWSVAESADWSAARSAARSAAESAAWSAWSAAKSAEYRWMADTLCELLAAAPTP